MSEAQLALGRLQRRLWRLISDPEGVAAALDTDPEGSDLPALLRGDRGLAPEVRLSVYAHAYFARIHDALRSDFGALARALGPEAFHDLVKTYLMAHPPSHPSLRYAGELLPRFLETEPFAAIFARRCAYAADLARLEWAITHAFDAENAPVLARADLAAVAPHAWSGLRFRTSPSLAILSLRHPVHGLRERFDRESEEDSWHPSPALAPRATHVRVWRREESVCYREMPALEAELLRKLERGEEFGALCEAAEEALGEEAAPRTTSFLERWLSAGLLSAWAEN
jgi:hypothetical protein